MKKTFTILAIAAVLFTSCKKEETTDAAPEAEAVADGTVATPETATATPAAEATAVATGTDGNSVMYNPNAAGTATATSVTPRAAAPVATPKGMNPPHGQPGHRCDISVGAPLNSPAKSTATNIQPTVTQATTVTPAMMNQTNNAPPQTVSPIVNAPTAPGMNPPHGQEGHVCGVEVGAPLPKK